MKRKLSFFLAILLFICMTANVALAAKWICPTCGTSNTGNYCSNCGTKKPVSSVSSGSSTITNVAFAAQGNGDTLVTWNDSTAASLYGIKYTTKDWDTYYYDNSEVKRVVLKRLIPGVTYQISITNGVSVSTLTYTVPNPLFSEYPAGDQYLTLTRDRFSLSEIEKNPMLSFQIQVSYPKLKYSREYTAKLVLKTPYGYCGAVVRWDSFEFENQYVYVYSFFYMKSDWLDIVEDDFGSIPTGKYTFEIYMDGQLYGYENFTLTN